MDKDEIYRFLRLIEDELEKLELWGPATLVCMAMTSILVEDDYAIAGAAQKAAEPVTDALLALRRSLKTIMKNSEIQNLKGHL